MPIHVQLAHIIHQCMANKNQTAYPVCPDIIVIHQGSPNQLENARPAITAHLMNQLEVQLRTYVHSTINVLRARRIQFHVPLDITKQIRAQRTVTSVRQVHTVHVWVHLTKWSTQLFVTQYKLVLLEQCTVQRVHGTSIPVRLVHIRPPATLLDYHQLIRQVFNLIIQTGLWLAKSAIEWASIWKLFKV